MTVRRGETDRESRQVVSSLALKDESPDRFEDLDRRRSRCRKGMSWNDRYKPSPSLRESFSLSPFFLDLLFTRKRRALSALGKPQRQKIPKFIPNTLSHSLLCTSEKPWLQLANGAEWLVWRYGGWDTPFLYPRTRGPKAKSKSKAPIQNTS